MDSNHFLMKLMYSVTTHKCPNLNYLASSVPYTGLLPHSIYSLDPILKPKKIKTSSVYLPPSKIIYTLKCPSPIIPMKNYEPNPPPHPSLKLPSHLLPNFYLLYLHPFLMYFSFF